MLSFVDAARNTTNRIRHGNSRGGETTPVTDAGTRMLFKNKNKQEAVKSVSVKVEVKMHRPRKAP